MIRVSDLYDQGYALMIYSTAPYTLPFQYRHEIYELFKDDVELMDIHGLGVMPIESVRKKAITQRSLH